MSVNEYLDMMLSNDVVHDLILKHHTKLEQVLSDDACVVVEQITDFDLDVIEVSNGYAFRISTRAFFRFRKEDFRGKSSRAFVPYDCLSPPDPGRFAEGITNSFPDLEERIKVLNKLYQCLVVGRMPREIRKLVLAGPESSGKTSWAAMFQRIMPADKCIHVTSELLAGMVQEDTHLVIIDDYSSMDLAKNVLQRPFSHNIPFYIATNQLAGDDDIYRKTQVFRTRSLPSPTPGADRWIFDHAMDCIAWMANVINENVQLIEQEERWYEDTSGKYFYGTVNLFFMFIYFSEFFFLIMILAI